MCNSYFFRPDNRKWQRHTGKSALPIPHLVHNECIAVSGGSRSQGLQPSGGHALTHFCVPFRGLFIQRLWLKPFSGASAETSYPGKGGKTLKTLFLHFDPVLSTFLFLVLPSPSHSTLHSSPPGPQNCKILLFEALLALR